MRRFGVSSGMIVAALMSMASPARAADSTTNDWRAGAGILVERVERLAKAGEVDAAAAVMRELFKREKIGEGGLDDRARMALARAYLAAGRGGEALAEIKAIPWADKSPQLAADIVALELAIRWLGLLDRNSGNRLVSGAIPAVNSPEAPGGRAEGVWQNRWEDFRAFVDLLNRGARMVRAEGGTVTLPASSPQLALARYGRGDLNREGLRRELGNSRQWASDLALAVALLHLSESEVDDAATAAEEIWTRFQNTDEARTAFRQFRIWQNHRRLAGQTIRLWSYPGLERRLDALASTYAGVDAEVRKSLASLQDLNEVRMRADIARTYLSVTTQEAAVVDECLEGAGAAVSDVPATAGVAGNAPAEYRLALAYDGLQLRAPAVQVSAGMPVSLTVESIHRGEHAVHLYRLPDFAGWQELGRSPDRKLLPAALAAERTLDLPDWTTIGSRAQKQVEFTDLAEGFYAATVSARGSPVVSLVGFMVVAPDLRLVAGRDCVLGWVVRRADGTVCKGEPVVIEIEEVRNAVTAGGPAYAAADPAWQAGFREGFLGVAEESFRVSAQEALFREGLAAGRKAAEQEPGFRETRRIESDAQGIVRFDLPEPIRGRSYEAKARIDRPEVRVESRASHGADAHWTRKAVVWADKPLARPGETVRYKAVLRDFNGENLRRPVGTVKVCIRLDDHVVNECVLPVNDAGAIWSEIVLPPACERGTLTLAIDEGPRHTLAQVDLTELPPMRGEFADDDADRVVRCGESTVFRLRLTDAGGEPLPDVEVSCLVSAITGSIAPPCEQPPVCKTDLAGEVAFRVSSLASMEAYYQVGFRLRYANRTFFYNRSFRTQVFPFRLDVELPEPSVEVGGALRVLCRLPEKAAVNLQLATETCFQTGGDVKKDDVRRDFRGQPMEVRGRGEAWVETVIPVRSEHKGANVLRISTATLDGKVAERWIPISIQPAPELGKGRGVELALLRRQVKPDGELPMTLGVRAPGRDVLLIGAARSLCVTRVERLDEPTRGIALKVDESWAPNLYFEATAYLPDQGFVATERQEAQVLPVHRLLTVEVRPERAGYRPGDLVHAAVRVTDWKARGVPDCSISLGVVNALVYELARDSTPDLWRYFHQYRRSWDLTVGTSPVLSQPSALLWRSLLWQWQAGASSAGGVALRSGGKACGRYGGGAGGGRGALPPLLKPGQDPTVMWVADLRTDEKGEAVVSFTLPDGAARFLCTARAHDASADVLVGEVRTEIAATLPYRCEMMVPKFVRPGDRFTATVQVFNYRDQEVKLALAGPGGVAQEVSLAAHGRRRVPLVLVAPEPTGPIMRVGPWMGRRASVRVTVRGSGDAAPEVSAEADTLVLLPGMGVSASYRLVAGPDGQVRLPVPVVPGAAVSVRLRSWPDAAARRKAELEEWRQTKSGVRAAMAWLLAAEGKERRESLGTVWPTLGHDLASSCVRIAAIRRGESAGGVDHVPEGLEGDWVLARGRAMGLNLPAPRSRGQRPESLLDRVQVCAIALSEGWAEGMTLWSGLRGAVRSAEGQTPVVDAFAADAARLARDEETFQLLVARLGQCDWAIPAVAVLAAELIPVTAAPKPAEVTILGPEEPVKLKTDVFAEWCGVVKTGLCLSATPGALLAVETLIQQPSPAPGPDEAMPTFTWWQFTESGYRRMEEGRPFWPGRAHLLVVDYPEEESECEVVIALPSLLAGCASEPTVMCIESNQAFYSLSGEQEGALHACVEDYSTQVVAAARQALGRFNVHMQPVGERVSVVQNSECSTDPAERWAARRDLQHGVVSLKLRGGARAAIPVMAGSEGACAIEGALVIRRQAPLVQMPGIRMRVAVDARDVAVEARQDPGLAVALGRLLEELRASDIAWILGKASDMQSEDTWRGWLRILDPKKGQASLTDLVQHPRCGERGHWTTGALRAWVDGEPLLTAGRDELVARIGCEGPYTLEHVARLASVSRGDRRKAWAHLPMPQGEPRSKPASLERWCRRLQELDLVPRGELESWLWEQPLGLQVLCQSGFEGTLASWADFLRRELGMPVEIAEDVPVWDHVRTREETGGAVREIVVRKARPARFVGGANLGTVNFAKNNLGVFRARKGYVLRRLDDWTPQSYTQAALAHTVIEAIDFRSASPMVAIDFIATQAGVAIHEVGVWDGLPLVTFEARNISAGEALRIVGEVAGLSYTITDDGVEMSPVKESPPVPPPPPDPFAPSASAGEI